MAKVKLKRLTIDQYRSVAPGTELLLNDTWNVLLGQNGTGKTTLLSLIAKVVASDFSSLKDEPFALEYELFYPGSGSVVVRVENLRRDMAAERPPKAADPGMSSAIEPTLPSRGPLVWSCRATIRLEASPAYWVFSLTSIAAKKETISAAASREEIPIVSPFERGFLSGVLGRLRRDARRDVESAWREVASAQREVAKAQSGAEVNAARFDEGLEIFNAIVGIHSVSEHEPLHPASITFESFSDSTSSHGPTQISFTGLLAPHGVVWHILERVFKQRSLYANTDFLKTIASVLGFSSVELTWDLLKKEVGPVLERATVGHFGFKLTQDDGSIISHDLLSYGQKRLLAFFYYLAANPHIVIADELANGLHDDWIEVCLKEIGDRQAFLTSQSPLLLDSLSFGSIEDVQRSFLLCRREKRDGKNQIVWENLDEESARSFFRAYKTEAQHVSEVLRSKGLW